MHEVRFWRDFREAVTISDQWVLFECLEDLSYFLAPLVSVGAVHSGGYARDGRMVGYALLDGQADPDPDSGLYKRRVFFLLPYTATASRWPLPRRRPPAKPLTRAPSR